MLNSGHEQDKVHLLGMVNRVEVFKLCFADLSEHFSVPDLAVHIQVRLLTGITIRMAAWNKASEEERLDSDELLPLLLELFLENLFDKFGKGVSVFLADESILENSEALVTPKLEHVILLDDGFATSLGDTLEDL